jgi:hypothetical protein
MAVNLGFLDQTFKAYLPKIRSISGSVYNSDIFLRENKYSKLRTCYTNSLCYSNEIHPDVKHRDK